MEGIKHRPRIQRVPFRPKQLPGSNSTVDDDDGDVAKLHFIHISILLCPSPQSLGSVVGDVGEIANEEAIRWAVEVVVSRPIADDLVDDEIDE